MDLKAISDIMFSAFDLKSASWVLAAVLAYFALRSRKDMLRRIGLMLQRVFVENWRLALLGTTGVVLSLASGWTTWDGMRNFTGEPILSAMVTFGIQGVMLIVAWLIGESFATGMTRLVPSSTKDKFTADRNNKLAMVLGLAGLSALLLGTVIGFVSQRTWDANTLVQILTWGGGAILILGLLIIASNVDTLAGYFDAARVMIRTAVLWVMFLACMATSVFFSFDSLFSTIFPASERARAAELRAQNQVSGIISDITASITQARIEQTRLLFESKGWADYDAQMTKLATQAQGADKAIEAHLTSVMEDRRRGIAEQQERITTAQSGLVGLVNKKQGFTDELSRLKAERPALADAFAKAKGDVEEKQKEFDAKRVEAMAEERGVEGTGKVGKGAIYKQRKAEEEKARDTVRIAEERMRDAQKRFTAVDSRITSIEREVSGIDGEIAKLRGESQTAEQRISLSEEAKGSEEGVKLDPSRTLPQFERIRVDFRQFPKPETLTQIQQMCTQLVTAMMSSAPTKDRARGIDCDPKLATEAAASVFAIDAGAKYFEANCVGGDLLVAQKTTDNLFAFARKCAQDAGLPSKNTDQLRQRINYVELNRDDKANRFVVTWNAFLDGNRLAYLSLGIAIAIDSLVFMSGLFGANAVRSPLSDMPSTKARSADQLDAIIENALLPDKFHNAQLVISEMRPIVPDQGFTAEVYAPANNTNASSNILRVLTAGAVIGAVRRDRTRPDVYQVRPELFEFLSVVAKKSFESDPDSVRLSQLKSAAIVALQPKLAENADIVLNQMHPISEVDGFMAEVLLTHVEDAEHKSVVRKILNAGTSYDFVQRDTRKGEEGRYYIHRSLYNTVANIAASGNAMAYGMPALEGPAARAAVYGGSIKATQSQLQAGTPDAIGGTRQLPPVAAMDRSTAQPVADVEVDELREQYWGEMLASIGINSTDANRRLVGEGVQETALAGWKALEEQARRNRALDTLLKRHQDEQLDRLGQMYSSLLSATNGDRKKIDALDQVDREIEETLPILMLFPENGLINFLIEELELAARPEDGLRPGEQSLKDRLKSILPMMRQDLSDANIWRQIGVALGARNDGTLPIVLQMKRNSGLGPRGA
jgi:hypothetical protein